MSISHVVRPALTLFITAVLVIALLGGVHALTFHPIERQKRRTQEAAMREVLPGASEYREMQTVKSGSISAVYEGLDGDSVAGFVVELSPKGYSGHIDLIVGISASDKKITGIRVLRHTETPGLGALAVSADFYRRYDNRELVPLGVVRTSPGRNEIQAITSATITTRAITNAVNEAIAWYQGNAK